MTYWTEQLKLSEWITTLTTSNSNHKIHYKHHHNNDDTSHDHHHNNHNNNKHNNNNHDDKSATHSNKYVEVLWNDPKVAVIVETVHDPLIYIIDHRADKRFFVYAFWTNYVINVVWPRRPSRPPVHGLMTEFVGRNRTLPSRFMERANIETGTILYWFIFSSWYAKFTTISIQIYLCEIFESSEFATSGIIH